MDTAEKYYKKAVLKLDQGATINELYELLYKYERMEDYYACAGIHKAIKDRSVNNDWNLSIHLLKLSVIKNPY